MMIKKILLLYKKSTYKHYFLSDRSISGLKTVDRHFVKRFKRTHDEHYRTLAAVQEALKERGLVYDLIARGGRKNARQYDLVVTVGGDGTFLEGARWVRDQPILGVNSDTQWSVGRFCAATAENFPAILDNILSGKARIKDLARMDISWKTSHQACMAVNDILVSHSNPAAMSRYIIRLGDRSVEHRSSGLWISTAAGSTGAIHSAGGKAMPLTSRVLQYRVRELYTGCGYKQCLQSGFVSPKQGLRLVCLMKEGMVYIDGSHEKRKLPFGQELSVQCSETPLAFVAG